MTQESKGGISRRTLAKGVAWSIPAVVVVTAVPAYAASPGEPIIPSYESGSFCKHSSDDQAHAAFCFQNTTAAPITITAGAVLWNSLYKQGRFSIAGAFSTVATVPANTTQCFWVDTDPYPSLGNAPATLYFTYPGALGGLNSDGSPSSSETPSVTTAPDKTMSNCNSAPGQPGRSAPHSTTGPS